MPEASLQAVISACLGELAGARRLSPRQWQVCHHLGACRTPALGGFALACDTCPERPFLYHACRDRHCPRCQRRASEAWCERQRAAVLPVPYHHLVFTLPHALDGWVELHPKALYDLLFETVWATLCAFGADPKRLDGQLGMTAVLHTWGQTLVRHVHLHCLVPGGAVGADGRWHPARSTYLFPVRALSRHFRGGFLSRLRRAWEAGKLPRLTDAALDAMREALMGTEWVVYSKPCIAHTETVVDYLGRYSHRIALSDRRILSFADGEVELAYKDYGDGRNKVMTLAGTELLRRFLLHVLPKGFMRSTGLCGECRWRAAASFVISTDCVARTVESLRIRLPSFSTPVEGGQHVDRVLQTPIHASQTSLRPCRSLPGRLRLSPRRGGLQPRQGQSLSAQYRAAFCLGGAG